MTTAEALAVVREARPSTPDVPCIHCTHDFCRCRRETEEFDAALALIEERLRMMQAQALRADEWQDAAEKAEAERDEIRAALVIAHPWNRAYAAEQRVAELEAALRDLLNEGIDDIDPRLRYVMMQVGRETLAAARRALQPKEDA